MFQKRWRRAQLWFILAFVCFTVSCCGLFLAPSSNRGGSSNEPGILVPAGTGTDSNSGGPSGGWFWNNSSGSDSSGSDSGGSWDSGGSDSGSWDSGGSDSGSWDSGGSDSGSWDSGGSDSGSWDSGGGDSGGDSGGSDSGSW